MVPRMGMTVYVDTREKPRAIGKILSQLENAGAEIIHRKLDVGDYMLSPDGAISVDRKQNLTEVCGNLAQQHRRFSAECLRAKEAGIKLVILVEHGGKIRSLEDVYGWKNPRLSVSPYALSGPRVYAMMRAYEAKYGVEWAFCRKQDTGNRILDILTRG